MACVYDSCPAIPTLPIQFEAFTRQREAAMAYIIFGDLKSLK